MNSLRANSQRGSAMLLATIVVLAVVAIAGTILTVALLATRETAMDWETKQTLLIAEAGINIAIKNINANLQNPSDAVGTVSGTYAGGSYNVAAVYDPVKTRYTVTAVATLGKTRKGIEAIVQPGVPFPNTAAFTIFGPAKQIEVELEPHGGGAPVINGLPGQKPALVVQDAGGFANMMPGLLDQVKDGKITSSTLQGAPLLTYTLPDGGQVQLPIGQSNSVQFDGPFLESLRLSIVNLADHVWIPNANFNFTKTENIFTSQTFGSAADPQIVVFSGEKIEVKKGATLTGTGTLIVTHKLKLDEGAALNWTGNIIVLGNNAGKAEFQNNRGTLNVDGNIFVIGNQKETELKIKTEGNGGKADPSTTITGSIMALSGAKGEEAEVEVKNGNTTINGLFMVQGGDEAEFELETKKEGKKFAGQFSVNGAVAVGVMNPGGEVEVEMEGQANIVYDQSRINSALNGLSAFVTSLYMPVPFVAKSWREFNP